MSRPLPPPLPPAERTVGQLIAEAIRLYGRRFWPSLALGVPLAVFDELALGQSAGVRALIFLAATPFFAATYAFACAIALDRSVTLRAVALGTAVLLPVSLFVSWFALLVAAYLALVGLVVPASMSGEEQPLRRAVRLGRADYVHALGSLASLVILFYVARIGLVALLRAQAESTIRVAVGLADLVVSPLVFLGSALLYLDQAARVVDSRHPTRRRRDADLPTAVDADGAGRPNAEVQS